MVFSHGVFAIWLRGRVGKGGWRGGWGRVGEGLGRVGEGVGEGLGRGWLSIYFKCPV